MGKKGAHSSGGGAGRKRTKDAAMASHLPPSLVTWRHRPEEYPQHNNLGTHRRRPDGKCPSAEHTKR